MRTFVDTNIVLYAYDRSEPEKSAIAREILSDLWRTREGLLSTQVLQELYVNLTRKLRVVVPRSKARALVGRYGRWPVHAITTGDILARQDDDYDRVMHDALAELERGYDLGGGPYPARDEVYDR